MQRVEVVQIGARVEVEYQGQSYSGTVKKLPAEDESGQGRYGVHCNLALLRPQSMHVSAIQTVDAFKNKMCLQGLEQTGPRLGPGKGS